MSKAPHPPVDEIKPPSPRGLIKEALGLLEFARLLKNLARELAREYPTQVRQVITMGSPVVGGPKYTVTAGWYRKMGYDLDEIERAVAERYARPLTVPVTAIFSKNDRIVAWQACIDRQSPNVKHIEVRTTHSGLGFDPDVYRIIARRFAAFK